MISNGTPAMLSAAKALAVRGWHVLPVNGKVPLVKNWPDRATTDETTITDWWTQHPAANIGIATGERSALFVLDVDPKSGGDESLRLLEAQHSALPDTVEVVTGGGGRHIYFQYPGNDVGNSASQLGPGLDIKTEGGQVVAPPSKHPTTGRLYEWEAAHHPDDVPLAEVPPWLLKKLTASTITNGQSFTSPERICDGARNDILWRTGRSLKAKGLSRKAIRDALHAENREKCQPPLPDTEIEAIVESAWSGIDRPEFTPRPPTDETEELSIAITETASVYTVTCATHQVRFTFTQLTDERGGVKAELIVHIGTKELQGATDIRLKSSSSRDDLARTLKARVAEIPWKWLIERACTGVLTRYREGEPVIVLQPAECAHVPFLVNPLIYDNHQTLFFAPGGSLKSYFALYLALLACHGASQHGLAAIACPVLYLDWELNQETVGGRLKALRAGHPELSEFVPYYRRCEAPLLQDANQIASDVASRGVRLVIVDSVAMACGAELSSPEAAIKLQRALRMIGCASLVMAHTSKSVQDGQERSAYGTVFFRELARNQWELQRAEGDDPVRLALHHRKNNFGRQLPSLGFEFAFEGDAVQVTACDPNEEPAFEDKLPVASRIRNLLEDGTLRTAQTISDELHASLKTVKSVLSRNRGIKWQKIGENRDAQWTVWNR